MEQPKIRLENDENTRHVVNVGGIPESTNDVTPKFQFKDDRSDTSSMTQSVKSSSKSVTNLNRMKKQSRGGHHQQVDSRSGYNQQADSRSGYNPEYSLYADPKKLNNKQDSDDEEDYSDSDSDDESVDDDDESVDDESQKVESKKPALSRLQLKIKKKDMLLKLHEAEQNGYQLTGKYNMSSELEEMEAEYELYEQKMEQSTMIDFMQDGLMFIIKGIEVLNGIYNPMNIKLNGLSDKVYDRKEKLEHVFRRLAIKYSGGTEMPPELSLLFIIGGAMIMTHMSNTALSGGGIEKLLSGVNTGGIMDSISKIMGQVSNQGVPVAQNEPTPQGKHQTMRSPNFDISSILKERTKPTNPISPEDQGILPLGAMSVPTPNPFPKPTRNIDYTTSINDDDRFSVTSSVSSTDDQTQSVTISIPSRKSSNRKRRSIQI